LTCALHGPAPWHFLQSGELNPCTARWWVFALCHELALAAAAQAFSGHRTASAPHWSDAHVLSAVAHLCPPPRAACYCLCPASPCGRYIGACCPVCNIFPPSINVPGFSVSQSLLPHTHVEHALFIPHRPHARHLPPPARLLGAREGRCIAPLPKAGALGAHCPTQSERGQGGRLAWVLHCVLPFAVFSSAPLRLFFVRLCCLPRDTALFIG
jgi:hypothetical protein